MKKIILLMCALIAFIYEGNAQWKFSAIAGPQLATFGGKDKKEWGGTNNDPELVVRFHGGLLAERRHSEKMAFITGLLYSSKGTKYSGEFQNVTVSYTKLLSYLDLPLLLRYYKSEKWSFLFGPQFSFLLAAKIKNDENAQQLFELPETEDAKDYYTKLDVGLNLGAAYTINERMALMLLFQYGLLKIGIDEVYDNNGNFEEEKFAIMNRVLML
ncbi:MAG TPA: outer membrane beta-barrel protein, partial [Ignavibacteriaceae bacterium]